MTLTKTQAEVMKMAARRGTVCVTRAFGRGQQGGRINDGSRLLGAALALETAGLLIRVSHDREMDTRHGHTVVYTTATFRLPTTED
jgi:hypothetical protein